MGSFTRHMYYRTIKIELLQYQEYKKRKAEATENEKEVLRLLGWEQASVAILENILKYVDELIATDEEVNELIKEREVSRYDYV